MEKYFETHFFLGANAPGGFYSLYDNFTDPERDRLFIIKGGPGSGKSTFMRVIADAAKKRGISTEYIHCSGDPDSLDGVRFPQYCAAFVDGTAPHVTEPTFAGVQGTYVDLSSFYDDAALSNKKEEIIRLTRAYKAYYGRAYALISAAYKARKALRPEIPEDIVSALERRAKGIIMREIKSSEKGPGRVYERFLTAVTCAGSVSLFESVSALCGRVYLMDNELGCARHIIAPIELSALDAGWDIIRCPDPMEPEVTEHLIIPELSLAFISQTSALPYTGSTFRHLRLDAIPSRQQIQPLRADAKKAQRMSSSLMDEAISALNDAKLLHDRLESAYNPHVDFSSVRALAEAHAAKLFG